MTQVLQKLRSTHQPFECVRECLGPERLDQPGIAAVLGESIAPIVAFLLMVIVGGIVLSAMAPDPEPLEHERPLQAVPPCSATTNRTQKQVVQRFMDRTSGRSSAR